jgi:hypothetical protein
MNFLCIYFHVSSAVRNILTLIELEIPWGMPEFPHGPGEALLLGVRQV